MTNDDERGTAGNPCARLKNKPWRYRWPARVPRRSPRPPARPEQEALRKKTAGAVGEAEKKGRAE